MADDRIPVPPVLYLPVQDDPELEKVAVIHRLEGGRSALIAFTALDRLVDACGERQEWVLVHLAELDEIRQHTPFDVVAFDPAVPAEARSEGRLA